MLEDLDLTVEKCSLLGPCILMAEEDAWPRQHHGTPPLLLHDRWLIEVDNTPGLWFSMHEESNPPILFLSMSGPLMPTVLFE